MKQIYKVLVVFIGTTLIIGAIAFAHHISKLPESVFVQKLGISQTTFTELDCSDFACASTELEAYAADFLVSQYTWTSERGEVTIALADMGLSIDTDKATRTLENFMDGTDSLEKLIVYLFGGDIAFELIIDEDELKAAFAESGIEQGVKNANYAYVGGTVGVQAEQIGYGIDQDEIAEILQELWEEEKKTGTLDLPLRVTQPEFSSVDLEELLEYAQEISSYEIELQGEWGSTWDLVFADHMDWFLPNQGAGEYEAEQVGDSEQTDNPEQADNPDQEMNFMFKINTNLFDEYLDLELTETVEEEAQPVTILEDEEGNYTFEGSARFGKLILREELDEEITALVAAKYAENDSAADDSAADEPVTMELLIPLETVMPEITVPDFLREKGVTDLLEFGYTNFAGSPYNRILNVNHGMDIYNGHIIEQDEEFSFTTLLGPVDGAHGWKEELVIVGDETKPEYGGGLCQVSSTIYRAALYSGLPITMRKEHSYAVSYYAYPNGYGLDATVYQPYPDLRFLNDTEGAILVQGYTDGTLAYFVFYGTNDGRSVQMEGPTNYGYTAPPEAITTFTDELEPGVRELDEHSHTGFQVDSYRTITAGDGTVGERENIHTYYEARPERWLEGTALEDLEDSENSED